MELRQLHYFVAVADTLSFSRAAEILYVSQPALSKQIASLEEELGVPLFTRGGKRSISLTQEGELLLHEAKEILIRSDKLIPMLRHSADSDVSRTSVYISIGPNIADDPFIHKLLTNAVYAQRQRYPGLRALFYEKPHHTTKTALIDGSQDLGIFLHAATNIDESLETLPLYQDEMVLVFRSKNHYEDTIDNIQKILHKRGLILLNKEPEGMSQILTILDRIDASPHIRFCDHRNSMTLTIESGEGATILPASIAHRLKGDDLHILHFRDPAAKIFLLAAWFKGCRNDLVFQIANYLHEKLNP